MYHPSVNTQMPYAAYMYPHQKMNTQLYPGPDQNSQQWGYMTLIPPMHNSYPPAAPFYQPMPGFNYPPTMPQAYGNPGTNDPASLYYTYHFQPYQHLSHPSFVPHVMNEAMNYNYPHMKHYPPYPPSQPLPTVPPLEFRRGSCSSAESVGLPQTPSLSSTWVESAPSIAGESYRDSPSSPSFESSKSSHVTKNSRGNGMPGTFKLPQNINSPGHPRNSLFNPSQTKNVYIRGLGPDTDDEKLYQLASPFGKITSYKAIIDKDTGFCKGYGFAMFERMDDAKSCILGMAKWKLDAGFARESFNARLKGLSDPTSTNLYVSNLPPHMDDAGLNAAFSGRHILSTRILRDAQGNSRGVGFVRLSSRAACDRAIAEFTAKQITEGDAAIQVRYADTPAQKSLKENTTRVREYYCSEQKKMLNGESRKLMKSEDLDGASHNESSNSHAEPTSMSETSGSETSSEQTARAPDL